MTPLYIALEGPHGAGKSTFADALVEALSRDGIDARAFHHEHADASLTPWQRALYFAQQRSDLVAAHQRYTDATRVVICDRWTLSTWTDATAGLAEPKHALMRLAEAEDMALLPVRYVILDAPQDTLRERILARGERPDWIALHMVQYHYRSFARRMGPIACPVIDTSQPRDAVLAQLVAIVKGWL